MDHSVKTKPLVGTAWALNSGVPHNKGYVLHVVKHHVLEISSGFYLIVLKHLAIERGR